MALVEWAALLLLPFLLLYLSCLFCKDPTELEERFNKQPSSAIWRDSNHFSKLSASPQPLKTAAFPHFSFVLVNGYTTGSRFRRC